MTLPGPRWVQRTSRCGKTRPMKTPRVLQSISLLALLAAATAVLPGCGGGSTRTPSSARPAAQATIQGISSAAANCPTGQIPAPQGSGATGCVARPDPQAATVAKLCGTARHELIAIENHALPVHPTGGYRSSLLFIARHSREVMTATLNQLDRIGFASPAGALGQAETMLVLRGGQLAALEREVRHAGAIPGSSTPHWFALLHQRDVACR